MDECKVCANADNEYCFACDNGNQFKPTTNADRIRAMSDEELAGEMFEMANYACPPGKEFTRTSCGKYPDCNNCWLNWLKQELR